MLTQFSGSACSGLHGRWFLNVTQGGGAQTVRPSYRLIWSFAGGTTAQPSGTVTFSSAGQEQAAGTLMNGTLSITGSDASGKPVSGQGSLSVQLSGTMAAPSVTLTESGLTAVESELGMSSPFIVNGGAAVIPITESRTVAGCTARRP